MAKKAKCDCPAGLPGWLATFADLMSLLLCFFILIVSFSSTEIIKFKKAMGSLQGALGVLPYETRVIKRREVYIAKLSDSQNKKVRQAVKKVKDLLKAYDKKKMQKQQSDVEKKKQVQQEEQKKQLERQIKKLESEQEKEIDKEKKKELDKQIAKLDKELDKLLTPDERIQKQIDTLQKELQKEPDKEKRKELEKQIAQLEKELDKELEKQLEQLKDLQNLEDQVKLQITNEGIAIRLSNDMLFSSGKSDLNTAIYPLLDLAIDVAKGWPNKIKIEGHTDNIPINTTQFPSNWELSSSRAISVLKYFVDTGNISPEKISAEGFAEFRPLAPNNNLENRAKNRRVEIFINYDQNVPDNVLNKLNNLR